MLGIVVSTVLHPLNLPDIVARLLLSTLYTRFVNARARRSAVSRDEIDDFYSKARNPSLTSLFKCECLILSVIALLSVTTFVYLGYDFDATEGFPGEGHLVSMFLISSTVFEHIFCTSDMGFVLCITNSMY